MTIKKVLIADDEESYRLILSQQLSKAGYTVVLASDGAEAISRLKSEKIQVALVDVQMPNVSGLDVMKFVKDNALETRVIVLTGYADLKVAIEAKEQGAVDFLNKPFTLSDVLSSVRQAFE